MTRLEWSRKNGADFIGDMDKRKIDRKNVRCNEILMKRQNPIKHFTSLAITKDNEKLQKCSV